MTLDGKADKIKHAEMDKKVEETILQNSQKSKKKKKKTTLLQKLSVLNLRRTASCSASLLGA